MKPWGSLGVVETIYEEEYEYSSSSSSPPSSPSVSPSILPSTSSPFHSRIQSWSTTRGQKTDALIHVQGTDFHLHKDPLCFRSTYLRRQLTERSEITLSPPLNITAETFALVADFCYGSHLLVTPFNVASLLLAAELLGMTEPKDDGDQNLKQITEGYFNRFVAVNGEYAAIVFRSCLVLLPEAETAALLVSRCVEVMNLTEDGHGVDGYFDEVISLGAEDFKIVAESMHRRFEYHDLLYRIVDFYLEEHNGKITDEQKAHICNSIDCNKLSPQLLLHAVQNPRMPLRFVVRAMLAEQLNTRRSIFSASNHHTSRRRRHSAFAATGDANNRNNITLGSILQRDAAMRENAQLKAAMDATSSRIQTLEKQLLRMRKILQDSDDRCRNKNVSPRRSREVMESARSASFHFGSGNRIERSEIGNPSSVSFRLSEPEDLQREFRSSSSENSVNYTNVESTPRIKRNIGQRLLKGLKFALRVPKSATKKNSSIREGEIHGKDEFITQFDPQDSLDHIIQASKIN